MKLKRIKIYNSLSVVEISSAFLQHDRPIYKVFLSEVPYNLGAGLSVKCLGTEAERRRLRW